MTDSATSIATPTPIMIIVDASRGGATAIGAAGGGPG
jgi:hypothetical protein